MRLPNIGSLFHFDRNVRTHDPDTSHAAAVLTPMRRNTHKHQLLEVFDAALPLVHSGRLGDCALNAFEASARAELPPHSCWWKRVSELKRDGLIVRISTRPDPRTGTDREAYIITDAGRSVLASTNGSK